MKKPSKTTYAIRFRQTDAEIAAGETPLYVTYDAETFPGTGYGYCCPCAETKQFENRGQAEKAISSLKLDPENGPGRHEVVDSETAAKQKAERKTRKRKVAAAPTEDLQPDL